MKRLVTRVAETCRGLLRAPTIERLSIGAAPDPVIALLLHDSTEPCLVIDRHGRVLRANPALRALLGPATDIPAGADAAMLFDPASRSAIWHDILRLLRDGVPRIDARPATLDAGAPVLVFATAIRNARRGIDGALVRFDNISQQTRLAALLQQRERLHAVGQFAASIAHDFNNVLSAILGAAHAIATRPGADPGIADEAGQIRNDAGRGAALVRQLLDVSRQHPPAPCAIAVNRAMTAMAGMLRRLIGATIRLDLDLEQPGRTIRADPAQLDQILINLAVNARDAMPDGGVLTLRSGHLTLYRERANGLVPIPPGRYVTIEVADTGHGIPPEVLPWVIAPFFTTKGDSGGTGLGLATVHSIAQQSGGHLTIDSSPGKGTRVRILFPHTGEPPALPASPAPPPAPAAPDAAPRVLLLVDDEEPVRLLAARSFESRGWTVLCAGSGAEALAILDATGQPVSGIVTDMTMPGMDGASLLRAIRSRADHADVPAILVSGYLDVTPGPDGSAFMAKPYVPGDLVARLEAMLQGRHPPAV